ncbi:MAG: replication protein RepA [Acidithiobacillus sp.]|nr:replication protein RepA [Acidithiobacillus sp.]
MTNTTKNGGRQTALNLDGGSFDEAAYRAELIAAGLPAEDAATVAAKTANARRDALNANEYRLKLIDAGMGVEQAKQAAATAARFLATPEGRAAEAQRLDGFQSLGSIVGASLPTGAKKAAAAPKAQPKEPAIIQRTAKPGAIITPQQNKLLDVGAEIASTKQDEYGEFMSFTHAVLCQVGLPRAKTDAREFMRKSGDAWVNVQAGWLDEGKGPVQQPIPYGAMPRLALAWVSSYAKRYSTREIPIGDSAAEFLRLMGMESQGARYATLRKQMHALAACRLQLGFKGRTFNGQPVEQFDAWVADGKAGQRSLWPGVMLLSDVYFNSLMDSAVPLDNRALHALKGSALALDVYAWLAHRLHRIEGRPVILHWKSLREQFAQEYKGKDPDKNFKQEFLPVLRNVQVVYPQAKVKQVTGGLMLMASPPPIPKKS